MLMKSRNLMLFNLLNRKIAFSVSVAYDLYDISKS